MQGSLIALLVTAIIVAVFAVLNAETVSINLLFAKFELSQAVVILLSAALGALAMFLLNTVKVLKLKKEIKQLNKQITAQPTVTEPKVAVENKVNAANATIEKTEINKDEHES